MNGISYLKSRMPGNKGLQEDIDEICEANLNIRVPVHPPYLWVVQ